MIVRAFSRPAMPAKAGAAIRRVNATTMHNDSARRSVRIVPLVAKEVLLQACVGILAFVLRQYVNATCWLTMRSPNWRCRSRCFAGGAGITDVLPTAELTFSLASALARSKSAESGRLGLSLGQRSGRSLGPRNEGKQ